MSETFHEQFPVLVKSQKVTRGFSRGVAALVFGLRPRTCRPEADEGPRRTREKTSGTQGIRYWEGIRKIAQTFLIDVAGKT